MNCLKIESRLKRWVSYLLIFLPISIQAQSDEWTLHFPYRAGNKICVAANKVYCAPTQGLYFFNKDNNELNVLSKTSGLSDIEVSAIAYHEPTKKVMIGYSSGYIDIIRNDESIKNINDIFRNTSINSTKTINQIKFYQNNAYIATDFGIVVYDMIKEEIRESYRNIGPNGAEMEAVQTFVDLTNKRLYVNSTQFGLAYASLEGKNLIDFRNWQFIKVEPDTTKEKDQNGNEKIVKIQFDKKYTSLNGVLYTGIKNKGIYKYNFETETLEVENETILTFFNNIETIDSWNGKLVITHYTEALTYEPIGKTPFSFFFEEPVKDVYIESGNKAWGTVTNKGIQIVEENKDKKTIAPNGLLQSRVNKISTSSTELFVSSGGWSTSSIREGYGVFGSAREWKNINSITVPNFDIPDITSIKYDVLRKGYWIGSFLNGAYFLDSQNNLKRYHKDFEPSTPFQVIFGQTRITSIVIDIDNNVWFTQELANGAETIYKYDKNSVWTSYQVNASGGDNVFGLVIDDNKLNWSYLKNTNTIYVFDPKAGKNQILTFGIGKGNIPGTALRTFQKDKNNQIWVGTDKGVTVFTDIDDVLNKIPDAVQPIFENRPLLQDENVICMAVDGANRKWFGTENGVFLFNETGTENIYYFNTKNSLLPDNRILDIGIHPQTGEVFFSTTKGLASFRGDASEPEPTFEQAGIFPNPANSKDVEFVTINGLKNNSSVKVVDAAGRLVYQQQSNGGTVRWNIKTLDGKIAQSGVYQVYATDENHEERYYGKIVIVQ